jgi:arginyl-tRNA synthetase
MKARVEAIISTALEGAVKEGKIKAAAPVVVERPRKEAFGDYSTNLAMLLAPCEGRPAGQIAEELAGRIGRHSEVSKCEVAGPGFINIFLRPSSWLGVLSGIIEKGARYGPSRAGAGKSVLIEFVSANPTGPLHIGHGRGAAVGDALANLLGAAGFAVTKEYYINDVGRQIQTLGESVGAMVEKKEFPKEGYRGKYIEDLAVSYSALYASAPEEKRPPYGEFAVREMLNGIKKDLSDFGVEFDRYQSEKELHEKGLVGSTIEELKKRGHIYEAEGALWFKTTEFGDDKDRVVKKADGELTYFASDIAYHLEKAKRGFSILVNIWGADHHGYEARIRAVIRAMGKDPEILKVIFIQLVSLSRAGAPVAMGKREGEFVTLKEVMDEVGRDASRFFFLMRSPDAHLEFDLELAKKQAPENPVYYVQYVHARISSIMGFARQRGIDVQEKPLYLERLALKEEMDIIKHLGAFEEAVETAAIGMEPHRLTGYLQELAGLFHPYYNRNRVVTDDAELTVARLSLSRAVGQVVRTGLGILGVAAPEKM